MAGTAALGWTNHCKTGTLTASSSETGLGPTNLAGDQVSASTGWQTPNGIVTGATLVCTFATPGTLFRMVSLQNVNFTGSAVVTVEAYLTTGPTLVSTLTIGGPQPGYAQVVGIFSSDITADYVQITINDATNPDNHINVGGAFISPAWLPDSGITWDTTYGENVARTDTRTRGGQRYIEHLYTERYWNIAFDAIRASEAWDDLAELRRVAALGGNVLFLPDVTDVDLNRMAVLGILESQASSEISFKYHTTDARACRMQITERK